MRQLTHIGVPSKPVADAGYTRPRPPEPPRPEENGAFQPCAPAALVRIYTLEREWGFEYWLCPAGVDVMKAERWTVRKHRAPPFDDLDCYVHGQGCPGRAA